MSGKCNSYMANFKLHTISFVKSSNNSITVHNFFINKRQILNWGEKQREIGKMPRATDMWSLADV